MEFKLVHTIQFQNLRRKSDSDLTWLIYKKVPVKNIKSSWQVDAHSWQVDIHSWQVDVHSWQIYKNYLANLVKTSWQSLEGQVVYSRYTWLYTIVHGCTQLYNVVHGVVYY